MVAFHASERETLRNCPMIWEKEVLTSSPLPLPPPFGSSFSLSSFGTYAVFNVELQPKESLTPKAPEGFPPLPPLKDKF